MAPPANTHQAKKALLYNGHNRKPHVSARNDSMKWRRVRRNVVRWLSQHLT